MKAALIPVILVALTACTQDPNRYDNLTQAQAARKAPGLVKNHERDRVPAPSTVLAIGTARVGKYTFAVVQKAPYNGRDLLGLNQTSIEREVIPTVEQHTGCVVTNRSRSDRNLGTRKLVIPLSCPTRSF